jgi:tRNA(Ile)-lysidine synthase
VNGRARPAAADRARRCERFDAEWLAMRLEALAGPLKGGRFCVAYSGGVDSTALLLGLARLRRRHRFALRALHVNHQLQPGAAAWAAAAARRARAWRVAVRTLTVQVPQRRGRSLEAEARAVRYAALAAQLAPGEQLLTAHNQDDQLETVLMQLIRGAGLAGLAAMPGVAPFAGGRLLRPLLPVPRALLQQFLEQNGVRWIDDPSNLDERFDRNYLRQRVVPALRARWPAVAATVSRSARHAAEAQQLLGAVAERALDAALDGTALKVSVLRRLRAAERRALVRHWITRRGLVPPDQRVLEEVTARIIHARQDAQPLLRWNGGELRRHGDRLYAAVERAPARLEPLEWRWRARRSLSLPGGGSLRLAADRHGDIALGRLPALLQVRFRGGGERLGEAFGSRALKDLLQQSRLPPWQRGELPLLCGEGRILAVPGLWVAPQLAATAADARRARLVWTPVADATARI